MAFSAGIRFAQAALAAALGAMLAACSANPGESGCGALFYFPLVQMTYPIPGATSVPDTLAVLLYNTAPNKGTTRSSVPITLTVGGGATLSTTGIPIPNPAPSPTASPAYSGFTIAAVALPRLSAATTYQVFATQYESGCVSTGQTIQTNIGSFTTAGSPSP